MPTNLIDENPSVDGPDYVALVIEWDELADDFERRLRGEDTLLPIQQKRPWRTVGIAAGALGIAALAVWGLIHRAHATRS